MIICPTCRAPSEPKARYCSGCYTVFFANSPTGTRRLEATTNETRTWKAPVLFAIAFLGIWFLQIDASEIDAEPGSYRASAGHAKRSVFDWVAESTGFSPASTNEVSEGLPAWFLDNDRQLPCARGGFCDVVIRFDSGDSAAFLIERPNDGGARIIAVDSRGPALLNKSTRAQLLVDEERGAARSISITRRDGRWSIVDAVQEPAGARAGRPGGKDGV